MQHAKPAREPALNLPGLIAIAIAVLVAIHAGREIVSDETDARWLFDLAFVPGPFSVALGWLGIDDLVRAAGDGTADPALAAAQANLARFLTQDGRPYPWTLLSYALLHGSWLHVGLNGVWLAAFGSPVVRRIGGWRAGILALATAFGGALAHWAAHPAGLQPVIGASAVVSGFMAAAATFVFNRGATEGVFDHPETCRRATLAATFANRSAVLFLGAWFVINIVFGLAAGPLGLVGGGIAWEAHIGGLLVGLALFPWLDREAPARTGG